MPDDRLASQRAELIGPLVAAQFDLERAIGELARSGAGTGIAQSQLLKIGQLLRAIGGADAPTLAAMQASVTGLIAETQSIAQQGRDATGQGEIGEAQFAAVNARTRDTVQRISDELFERKIFDPYLRFANAEEEAEYRKREAEREAYIKRELAKGTPEGNLNASTAVVDQIKDAGRHGADQSPDYQRLLDEAIRTQNEQATAIDQNATRPTEAAKPSPRETEGSDFDQIAAAFKASGVVLPDTDIADAKGHGLADASIERASGQSARKV